jgi:hypothetical protein
MEIVDGDIQIANSSLSIYSSQGPADFETAVTQVQARLDRARPSRKKPSAVIITRTNPPQTIAAPANIVFGEADEMVVDLGEDFDIIRSQAGVGMFYLPEVRADPSAFIGAMN